MKELKPVMHERYPDSHHDVYSKTIFGFWLYLLTDFVMFATFFATYAVLHNGIANGPSSKEIFNIPFTFVQTLILLLCSFISGIGGTFAHRLKKAGVITSFSLLLVLGLIFMGMEIKELNGLIQAGHSWSKSAFLSAFFTIVGMHLAHVLFGLLWIIVLLIPVLRYGITTVSIKRLTCLRMFWQFLNVVWIFIFTIVYMMGAK